MRHLTINLVIHLHHLLKLWRQLEVRVLADEDNVSANVFNVIANGLSVFFFEIVIDVEDAWLLSIDSVSDGTVVLKSERGRIKKLFASEHVEHTVFDTAVTSDATSKLTMTDKRKNDGVVMKNYMMNLIEEVIGEIVSVDGFATEGVLQDVLGDFL